MNKTRLVDYKSMHFLLRTVFFCVCVDRISVMFGLVLFESLKIGIVFPLFPSFCFCKIEKYL